MYLGKNSCSYTEDNTTIIVFIARFNDVANSVWVVVIDCKQFPVWYQRVQCAICTPDCPVCTSVRIVGDPAWQRGRDGAADTVGVEETRVEEQKEDGDDQDNASEEDNPEQLHLLVAVYLVLI